jgi:hypothetical protein
VTDHITPIQYIYLDSEGITGLYSQITERLELEAISDVARSKNSRLAGKIRLGKALRLLLGFSVDAEPEGDLTLSKRRAEQVKSTLTAEQRLALLTRYFEKHEDTRFYRKLPSVKIQARQSGSAALIYITHKFDAPQFYDSYGGVDLANSAPRALHALAGPERLSGTYLR